MTTETDETDEPSSKPLDVTKNNGVYLIAVEAVRHGYIVYGKHDRELVELVRINDRYISTSDSFEIEVKDYHIVHEEMKPTNATRKMLKLIV